MENSHFNDQMRERTLNMSVAVQALFAGKVVPVLSRPTVNQLIRSSSSVASNYRAATRSRSNAEFLSKICIVVEEADETQFWLEYLVRTGMLDNTTTKSLQSEIEQLVKIFASIKKTMQTKMQNAS